MKTIKDFRIIISQFEKGKNKGDYTAMIEERNISGDEYTDQKTIGKAREGSFDKYKIGHIIGDWIKGDCHKTSSLFWYQ